MARFAVLRIVALSLAVLSATAGPARASVITTGDVDPGGAAIQPDPWAVGDTLTVGAYGSGTLNIESAGVVTSTDGYIGFSSGPTGVATVTGADSQWNNLGDLYVGIDGSGTLSVADDGLVTVGDTTSIGAMGTVNLTGGRFEFGQTTLAEFNTINATAGAMAGDVMITGVNDVALLPALQNPAVDLSDVAAVNEGLLHGSAILKSSLDNQAAGELRTTSGD